MLLFISAVAVVLIVSFLCSIFESVLLSLTRPQIAVLSRDGRRAGRLLEKFKDNMDVPIAAILILNTAAHTIGAAVAGASYSNVFDAGTLWLFSILFTIAVLLFTEIIPKTLGVSYAQYLATPVAFGIDALTRVLKPMVVLSEKISRSIRPDVEIPVTSTEEIRLLAAIGRSEGAVGVRTAGIIVGATHLRYLQAHDILLPREKVRFLSANMDREAVIAFIRETGHSRFPFSPTGNIGDVTGVVIAKQVLHWLLEHDEQQIDWQAIVQEALVVPETVSLLQLLRLYQESHRHLGIVVDEYGDVLGIASLEDVLEEIVGDIRDESDTPVEDFEDRSDGALVARAAVDLRRLAARLNVTWEPGDDVATIGGLLAERLERIPVVGDSIVWHDHVIEVLHADRRRARVVIIRPVGD